MNQPNSKNPNEIYDPFAIMDNKGNSQALPSNLLDLLNILSRVKKVRTTAPTHTPKNFTEQFEILNDGNFKLCVHCGTTWATVTLTII